ncbi:hypothetical protein [Aeromonas salmonicida]|uniref:hypothetical protein n=1 Tax=Aeromonas salmonicida TaxID=645 RepID=UPI00232B93E7|nr:hypothetical protein [Aeromonas salmonicida]WCH25183.1 hypothetical protein ONZ54_22685 [Aeromonas salmonicida]
MQDRNTKAVQSVLEAATANELVAVFDEITTKTPPAKFGPQHVADILAANVHTIDPEISQEQLVELMGATITTPIGPVRFGANQLDKLGDKGRLPHAGWIRPTLENPLMVLKECRGTAGDEREFSYLFVNALAKPDGKVRGFVCVTVQKMGDEVVISSHHIKASQIGRKMQDGAMFYRRPGAVGVFLESVRVEGSGRKGPLELHTGRPTADAPDTSIAPGDSSVAVNGPDSNYLDGAESLDFMVVDVQFEPIVEDEFDHGRVSYVATVKGASVRTAFKLVEANSLIASNGLDGKPNGAYPQELQPRDRTRVASVMQITKLSRSLQPARLADSGLSSQGAPIMGPDRVVESGNGRSMAIIKAYVEGHAGEYRQYLEDNAELYGFTTTQVKAFSSPVLVRVRLDEVDRAQFAKDSNVSDMQALSPTEQARIDAEAMDDGVMALFSPGASGDFLAASNRPFVSAFLAKLTSEQAAGLLTTDGRPTRQVIDRIRAAVFAKAYQHDDLLRLAVEEPDPEIRNVLSALTSAAPQFVTMRALSGEAHKQATDTLAEGVSMTRTLDEEALTALVDATTIVRAARDAGQAVEEYLKQGDMFGAANPQASSLAAFIAANNRSVKRMAEAFTAMAEEICQTLEHKGQAVADMFGEPPIDLVTVLSRVNERMAELYGDKAAIQVGMFDAAGANTLQPALKLINGAQTPAQVAELFKVVTAKGDEDSLDAKLAAIGRVVQSFRAVPTSSAMQTAIRELHGVTDVLNKRGFKTGVLARWPEWANNPVNGWFDGLADSFSWLDLLSPVAYMLRQVMLGAEARKEGADELNAVLRRHLSLFDSNLKSMPTPPSDVLLSWVMGYATTLAELRTTLASDREVQFERDTAEYEKQIRQLSLSVETPNRETAIANAIVSHMSKQKVLDELTTNPAYEGLAPAQRDSLASLMAEAGGKALSTGGTYYDMRTYEAVIAFIEQQRGQPNYDAASEVAVNLYQHYVKLIRTSASKPIVEGVGPLRAMLDELVDSAMPASDAAKVGAMSKIRISAASLAHGYDIPAMKADMNRFYQIVAGQMETPEIVRKKKRAYASREHNYINSGEGMTKTTLWHEMGHFVEYKHPELLIAAKQLLARRSAAIPEASGKTAYLKHMTGAKSYKNEVAVNDGFYHPYVGKIYGSRGIESVTVTEVFSMGFQALATDAEMARLAMKDPEHLAMVLAAVKMLGTKYKEAK